jgi:hypothetical protein
VQCACVDANINSFLAYDFSDTLGYILVLREVYGIDVELFLGEGEAFRNSVDANDSRRALELGPVGGKQADRT